MPASVAAIGLRLTAPLVTSDATISIPYRSVRTTARAAFILTRQAVNHVRRVGDPLLTQELAVDLIDRAKRYLVRVNAIEIGINEKIVLLVGDSSHGGWVEHLAVHRLDRPTGVCLLAIPERRREMRDALLPQIVTQRAGAQIFLVLEVVDDAIQVHDSPLSPESEGTDVCPGRDRIAWQHTADLKEDLPDRVFRAIGIGTEPGQMGAGLCEHENADESDRQRAKNRKRRTCRRERRGALRFLPRAA